MGRRGAESRGVSLVCVSIGCGGDPSAPRESSRPRAAPATCPPRSAARAVVAVPTPRPPPLFSQPRFPAARRPRSPSPSLGKEPFSDVARNPPGGVCGLPSKQFCGEKKKRSKVELNSSNSASSQAQTVSTGGNSLPLGSGFACFWGKAIGKPFNLGCHRVKSCTALQCIFQRKRCVSQPF